MSEMAEDEREHTEVDKAVHRHLLDEAERLHVIGECDPAECPFQHDDEEQQYEECDPAVPQTQAEARKQWGFGPKDDLYDVYGSASVFLR